MRDSLMQGSSSLKSLVHFSSLNHLAGILNLCCINRNKFIENVGEVMTLEATAAVPAELALLPAPQEAMPSVVGPSDCQLTLRKAEQELNLSRST